MIKSDYDANRNGNFVMYKTRNVAKNFFSMYVCINRHNVY